MFKSLKNEREVMLTVYSYWILSLMTFSLSLLFAFSEDVYSLNIKPRAREYYEVIKLQTGANEKAYRGLSNIINIWHEVQGDFSLGFAFGSIGSPYQQENNVRPSSDFHASFQLYTAGLEYKKWYHNQPFVRIGTYNNYFQMGAKDPLSGHSNYIGLGWEFDYDGMGIAAELGQKFGFYGGKWELNSKMFALGFHFYKS